MKNLYALLPLLAALLVPGKASAQILPDPSVQIVASWKVGDQMDYTFTKKEYEEREAPGNETQLASYCDTIHFKVEAATDSSYTLALTYGDPFNINSLGFPLTDEERAALPNPVYRIRTDRSGAFQEVENLDEIAAAFQSAIPVITQAIGRTFSDGQLAKRLAEQLVKEMTGPERLTNLVSADIEPLLCFFGSRFNASAIQAIEEPVRGIMGTTGEACNIPGSIWVDSERTNEEYAVIHKELHGDTEQLGPILQELLQPMAELFASFIGSTVGKTPDEKETQYVRDQIDEMFKDATIKYEENIVEEVHRESGWPVHLLSDGYVALSIKDSFRGHHTIREIRMVAEEGE